MPMAGAAVIGLGRAARPEHGFIVEVAADLLAVIAVDPVALTGGLKLVAVVESAAAAFDL